MMTQPTDPENQETPPVTVLMPVYNGGAYLAQAIESILVQTYRHFTLLILDDGSTDATRDIILSYDDPRIRLVSHAENAGITRRLNEGLQLSPDELVARMDADDLSHPWRLARQVAYLMKNPACAMVASAARLIDGKGNYSGSYDPWGTDPYYALNFDCYICHPSVMFRKSKVLEAGGYTMEYAEDFDLWWRLSRAHRIQVLGEPLLSYRVHDNNLSRVHRHAEYREYEHRIIQRNLRYLLGAGATVPEDWVACYHYEFAPILRRRDPAEIIACLDLLDGITEATIATENPNRDAGIIRYFARAKKFYILREVGDRLPLSAMIRLLFHCRQYTLAAELGMRKIRRFIKRKKRPVPAAGGKNP